MKYAIEQVKAELHKILQPLFEGSDVEIRTPPPKVKADFAVPLFVMAKTRKTNPAKLAQELVEKVDLQDTLFQNVEPMGGYLNFNLDYTKFNQLVVQRFQESDARYGSSELGKGKTVVIDYSAPNIAKPFSVGHLRSTVIGQAIYNIFSFLGYTVIGDNHIGDWGTQFGKLMCEYKRSGDKATVENSPIAELLKLYVKFHADAEKALSLEDEGRAWFKKLENGDSEAVELWKWFADLSWKEFERIYDMLGVKFDEVLGESFYNDKLEAVVQETFDKGLAEWGEAQARDGEESDEPAGTGENEREKEKVVLIQLEEHGISTPLLIQKSDGASLYATRDLATARYRIDRWNPEEMIYVVGGEQQLYFRQWFKVVELMGYDNKLSHAWFGMVRLPGGRMSTRKGRVIYLEDVLNEAVSRTQEILKERELSEAEKHDIARVVGIGAVKYADLSQNRTKDVVFDWDKMLNMQGDSGPYLQYAHVRIRSILRKSERAVDKKLVDGTLLTQEEEANLIKAIAQFPEIVKNAAEGYFPHVITAYLFSLAQTFSSFYKEIPVLKAESETLKHSRLYLCQMAGTVLKTGLGLLGIECPEKM